MHAVVARSTFGSLKCKSTGGHGALSGRSDVFLRGRRRGLCTCSKVSITWGFCSSFNCNHHFATLHSTALHLQLQPCCTTVHYTPLQSTDCITLHCTTLHYMTRHDTTLHCAPLPCTTLATTTSTTTTTRHYSTLITLHFTTLHSLQLQVKLHDVTVH